MNITQLEARRRAAERQIDQLSAPQKAPEAAEQELTALNEQIEQARQQGGVFVVLRRVGEIHPQQTVEGPRKLERLELHRQQPIALRIELLVLLDLVWASL